MNAPFTRVACLLLPLLAACAGADPTQLSDRHNMGGATATDPTTPAAAAGSDPADPAAPSGSSGGTSSGDVDGGADAAADGASSGTPVPPPPPPPNAFTGAGAFVSKLGPSARKGDHNFAGNNPPTSPKGQACSNCHNFFMGGTVFADVAGTTPAAGVEVRARDAAGTAVSAWTDQDGNFYLSNAGGLTLPASIGARSAATTKLMSGKIASGTCASSACHVAGKQGPIHLP